MCKEQIKVSIIVPVYNTSQYLEKCLDSLIKQTLKDIEIICVNDGSTDDSGKILENYAKKDKRVVVINQKNMGQSAARNAGLDAARGEYIGFVDSDDYVLADMYRKLYENALNHNSDVVMSSIKVLDSKTNQITENDSYLSVGVFNSHFDNRCFTYKDCKDFIFRICVVPWNKLYKASFLKLNGIKFVKGLNFEDNVFALEVFLNAKMSIVRDALIVYRRDSLTSYSFNNDSKKLDFFKVLDEQEKIIEKYNTDTMLKSNFKKHKQNTLLYWYKKIKDNEVREQYRNKLKHVLNESLH